MEPWPPSWPAWQRCTGIRGRIEGPWDQALAWIDTQLNRLWKARGAFPGLGSALSAFGYEWGFKPGACSPTKLSCCGSARAVAIRGRSWTP